MTEYSLHAQIIEWYALPGDELEVRVEDFIVDIRRGNLLIEIQNGNFSSIRKKLTRMVLSNRVRLVYPIARQKWIVYVSNSGEFVARRKSPKEGKLADLFYELVHTPSLVNHRNFALEVLIVEEEELRCKDGKGSWRRKGSSVRDRKLLNVFDRIVFSGSQDFLRFLPKDLDGYFTNKTLSSESGISVNLAQKITYCLRKMGTIRIVGKRGNEFLFQVS